VARRAVVARQRQVVKEHAHGILQGWPTLGDAAKQRFKRACSTILPNGVLFSAATVCPPQQY